MTRPRSSPALAVALLALVVALSGTAYAAVQLPKNSVGAKQLKADAVTAKKIKASAVTGAELAPGAVDGSKITAGAVGGSNLAADSVTGAKVPANSLTGADIDKTTLAAQPGMIVLQGPDFKPRGSGTTFAYAGGGGITPIAGTDSFLARLPLPSGVIITGVTMFFQDNDAAAALGAVLTKVNPANGSVINLSTASSTGQSIELRSMALSPMPITVEPESVYHLMVNFSPGLNLMGAKVTYAPA